MTMRHSVGDITQVTSRIYTGQQGDRGRAQGWENPAVEIKLHWFETLTHPQAAPTPYPGHLHHSSVP